MLTLMANHDDPPLVMSDRIYAKAAAERALEFVIDLENLRGTRRLYIP
jgi:hypothetical protein